MVDVMAVCDGAGADSDGDAMGVGEAGAGVGIGMGGEFLPLLAAQAPESIAAAQMKVREP